MKKSFNKRKLLIDEEIINLVHLFYIIYIHIYIYNYLENLVVIHQGEETIRSVRSVGGLPR